MAAHMLFSQHSSNPLEVSPSNRLNKQYLRRYKAAHNGDIMSSDDPIGGYDVPEMETYQSHISQLIPGAPASRRPTDTRMVDLDEDMESSDELVMHDEEEESGDNHQDEDMEECDGEDEDDDDDEPDTDAHGSTDEEMSIYLKPPEERVEIEEEIADLDSAVPSLSLDYKVVDRLGTGTFSSVYKALDLHYHTKWDNTPWHGHHPSSSSAYYQSLPKTQENKSFVAIKRIYVTSTPERIRNEIAIMEDCRGCRHVSQLITAFRHEDQVVAIMPYHKNEDFREFFRVLPLQGIKAYFRCMFRALRDIHARGVIHRDVKPANFLFDPRTGIGTLCDFGLACRMESASSLGVCLHTSATRNSPHGRIRPTSEADREHIKKMQKEARERSRFPSDKVGYPDKDSRPHSKANRAGTRGFRAPEVLLKCGDQTGAIDVWAVGMILLFFLTGKFPLFQSNDDIEALMEIATIIGKKRMEKAATLHSRIFTTNVPSVTADGITWRDFVLRQNPNLQTDERFASCTESQSETHSSFPPPPSSSSPPPSATPLSSTEHHLSAAFNLLDNLLQPESHRRFTPRQALYHPFLAEVEDGEEGLGDDEWFPHPFGEGVCGEMHFRDDVTEEPFIRVRVTNEETMGEGRGEVRKLVAGEGIAIGNWPCEFHKEEYGF